MGPTLRSLSSASMATEVLNLPIQVVGAQVRSRRSVGDEVNAIQTTQDIRKIEVRKPKALVNRLAMVFAAGWAWG